MSKYFRSIPYGGRVSIKYKYIHYTENGFTGNVDRYQSNYKWDDIPNSENVKLFGSLVKTTERETKGREGEYV